MDTTLDRVVVDDVVAGLPVREFRWFKGRRHYSGWYYSSTVGRLVVYESRLELARILLADFAPRVAAAEDARRQLAAAFAQGRLSTTLAPSSTSASRGRTASSAS